MRTRCPECATVFRVTSEQLRRKAGKVRCGHCQAVFNAFDHWQADSRDESPPVVTPLADESALPEPLPFEVSGMPDSPEIAAIEFDPAATIVASPDSFPQEDLLEALPAIAASAPDEAGAFPLEPAALPSAEAQEMDAQLPEARFDAAETLIAAPRPDVQPYTGQLPAAVENPPGADETPEQSAQAAREAGLVAARELADTAAYNRYLALGALQHEIDTHNAEGRSQRAQAAELRRQADELDRRAEKSFHAATSICDGLPSLAAAAEAALGAVTRAEAERERVARHFEKQLRPLTNRRASISARLG